MECIGKLHPTEGDILLLRSDADPEDEEAFIEQLREVTDCLIVVLRGDTELSAIPKEDAIEILKALVAGDD